MSLVIYEALTPDLQVYGYEWLFDTTMLTLRLSSQSYPDYPTHHLDLSKMLVGRIRNDEDFTQKIKEVEQWFISVNPKTFGFSETERQFKLQNRVKTILAVDRAFNR